MAQLADDELQGEANVIRDETQPKANTANRVGLMLNDIIDSKLNRDTSSSLNIGDAYIQLNNSASNTSLGLFWNDNDGQQIRFRDDVNATTIIAFAAQANNNVVTIPTSTGVLATKVNNISADASGNITVPSKLPINPDINISVNDYTIASNGVFMVVNAGSGTKKIIFPNPADYLGLTVIIINNTAASAPISATNQPLLRGTASAVTTIATGEMWQFISNGTWRGGKLS